MCQTSWERNTQAETSALTRAPAAHKAASADFVARRCRHAVPCHAPRRPDAYRAALPRRRAEDGLGFRTARPARY